MLGEEMILNSTAFDGWQKHQLLKVLKMHQEGGNVNWMIISGQIEELQKPIDLTPYLEKARNCAHKIDW